MNKKYNKAINADHKKLRCAPHFASGYGKRYAKVKYTSNIMEAVLS